MAEPAAMTDDDLINRAFQRVNDHARWTAIDELARRALRDQSLFGSLFLALRNDKTIAWRYRPYGTYLAVARVLDSGDKSAVRRLLSELDGWTAQEQADAIAPWTGHKHLIPGSRDLAAKYGWTPKYLLDSDAGKDGFAE